MLLVLLLIVGVKVAAVVTAVPEPPLPPLLQGLGGSGGSTTVCPPASEQEAASRRRFPVSPIGWSPELGLRLERQFLPGSDAEVMTAELQKLGFTMAGSCKGDPSIRHAFFDQHGGFPLRPGGLPMVANVWWQVDETDHLIWVKGMVAYDGL